MRRVDQAIRELFGEMDDMTFEEFHLGDRPGGDRHFDASEQDALSSQARGYLIALFRSRQITRMQMEMIIHYAVMYQQIPLTRRDLESIVDRMFFAAPWDPDLDIGESFPGKSH